MNINHSQALDISFHELLDSLPSAHVIVDRSLSIVKANTNANKLLNSDQVDNHSLSSFLVDADFKLTFDQLLAERGTRLRFKLKGQDQYVDAVFSVLGENADSNFLIVELHNIEDLMALEENLERQRRASASSARLASLGEMAGSVAHEINNPLAILMACSRVLSRAKDKGKLTDELVTKVISDVDATLDRISKIVSGLRTTTRESNNIVLTDIVLRDLFEEVTSLCLEKFKTKGIELKADLAHTSFDMLALGDRVQLSQVFINLLGNAFDAVEGLEARWVEIQVKDASEFVEIHIIDSGAGIPRTVADKMFTPFFTSKPVGKGTGLGLSISQNIINKNGGEIKIDHNHSNTCFVISLKKAGV